MDSRVILVSSLVGFLKNRSSSVVTQIRETPVSLSACHDAAEGALGHRAVNTGLRVGRSRPLNDAINHIVNMLVRFILRLLKCI